MKMDMYSKESFNNYRDMYQKFTDEILDTESPENMSAFFQYIQAIKLDELKNKIDSLIMTVSSLQQK